MDFKVGIKSCQQRRPLPQVSRAVTHVVAVIFAVPTMEAT